MTKVGELRDQLATLIQESSSEHSLVKQLLTELARHSDMEILELWRRIGAENPSKKKRAVASFDRAQAIQALGRSFSNDEEFHLELSRLLEDRRASRAELHAIYSAMFGKNKSLPSKATRESLVRDIADERNLLVRARKTAAFLSGT